MFFDVFIAVLVLAFFAAGLMKLWGPGIGLLSSLLREGTLRALTHGLKLVREPASSQRHAVARGSYEGHPVTLQLGAGRLRLEIGTEHDASQVPLAVATYYLRSRMKQLATPSSRDDRVEFCASSVLLDTSALSFFSPRRLRHLVRSMSRLTAEIERELSDPERLALDAQSPTMPSGIRARLIEYLEHEHGERAVIRSMVDACLSDPEPRIRYAAAKELGRAGRPTLIELTEDPENLSVSEWIGLTRLLADRMDPEAERALVRLMQHPSLRLRKHLLRLLGGHSVGIPPLLEIVAETGEHLGVRQEAAEILAAEHPSAVWRQALLHVLNDELEVPSLRQHACRLLLRSPAREAAIGSLWKISEHTSSLRAWAIAELAHHLGFGAGARLIDIARRDPTARIPVLLVFEELGPEGEDWLIECLGSDSPMVVEHAVRHLGEVGTTRALSPLKNLPHKLPELSRSIRAIESRLDRRALPMGGLTVCPSEPGGELSLPPQAGSVSLSRS